MTLEEAILHAEEATSDYEGMIEDYWLDSEKLAKCANEQRQLAEWLKILKLAKFEYDEAWRIITHPTPDVTYADRDRAQVILDTFRGSLGMLVAEREPMTNKKSTEKRTESHACDCISRQDAIRWIKTECNPYGKPTLDFESGKRVMKHLEQMPPAQPERKVGKWTEDNACEFCGFKPWYERDIHTLSYCSNCGADMRGERNG